MSLQKHPDADPASASSPWRRIARAAGSTLRAFALGRPRRLLAASLLVVAPLAQAGYWQWDTVELPASSGASCGNGTPYRFFVNRTPFTRDTVVSFEGGGACWDQASCKGEGKWSAVNPEGVKANYMSDVGTMAKLGLVTPFTSRFNPVQLLRTQTWNMVYLPYCTGDVHVGSTVRVYADSDPANPRVQHHQGAVNARAAAAWMRANMGQPNQLVLTGFSAGGAGSTGNYMAVRDTLAPTGRATLLADSGPLFSAQRGGSVAQYPSLPLHEKIRSSWGLDEPGGMVQRFAGLPGLDTNNMGTVARALALRYPQDRFGYMAFRSDAIYSGFSYNKFYPEIAAQTNPATRVQMQLALWEKDLSNWLPELAKLPNVGYYIPNYRAFNESHCLTVVDFSGTGIYNAWTVSVSQFIDNSMDRWAPMRLVEGANDPDRWLPLSPAMEIIKLAM